MERINRIKVILAEKDKTSSSQYSASITGCAFQFDEIAKRDEFVGSWTNKTREKCASDYLTIILQAELADKDGALHQPDAEAEDYRYYIENGKTQIKVDGFHLLMEF